MTEAVRQICAAAFLELDIIRITGGALFCERRYGVVFTFHNGADSYYSVRGWRGYVTEYGVCLWRKSHGLIVGNLQNSNGKRGSSV